MMAANRGHLDVHVLNEKFAYSNEIKGPRFKDLPQEVGGVIEIPHVFRVHLEERSETDENVADPALLGALILHFPLADALLQLRQQEIVMQLEQRFDVGEHLRNQFLVEHVVHAVLLIHAELEHLQKSQQNPFNYSLKKHK